MISDNVIKDAAEVVGRLGCGDVAVETMRRQWPALRFAACSDDDVPPRLKPAFEGSGFNFYYIGSGDHCLTLTKDADSAMGLVVAEVTEDD
ncbi:hypothetical protein GPA19_19450 [Azoarcus indigens]|uniref:DUF6129 domain-containing protein n=1 Tax=Azoarcus indigens TaxID=29545 RepID=A0A4V3BLZ6_9RHOO|nr:DUF6129 family protein [Azoarcus indigens]NMG67120.1 hypothetical protein [Azoarcus indigens]TDN48712.1 hypothetical protein C7389_11499 [Azoarcus indigens]